MKDNCQEVPAYPVLGEKTLNIISVFLSDYLKRFVLSTLPVELFWSYLTPLVLQGTQTLSSYFVVTI